MSDERCPRRCSEEAHVWPAPSAVGDRCDCGARRISQTVATGTWCGLTVSSWETEPIDGEQEADR